MQRQLNAVLRAGAPTMAMQQQHREQQQPQPVGGDEHGTSGVSPAMTEALVETRCPQPRRAFPAALFPSTPGNNSLGGSGGNYPKVPGSPSARSSTEEASNELRDLLVGGGSAKDDRFSLADSMGKETNAPVVRPLSSVSTCAGPTPTPEDRAATPMSQWFIPDRFNTPTLEETHDLGSSAGGAQRPSDKHVGNVSSQNRKVFVGGIPQDMNQDDLYTIFSDFAGVKKAWLQRYRPRLTAVQARRPNNASEHGPPHNHRGFGFVIFYESSAVDQMLGTDYSRFIPVREGGRLEVKRAVSSGDIANATPHASQARPKPTQNSNAPAQSTWQQPPSAQAQPVLMPQMSAIPWANSNGSLQNGVVSQQLPTNALLRGITPVAVSGNDGRGQRPPMIARRGSGVSIANQTMNITSPPQIVNQVPAPWVAQGVAPSWQLGIPDSRSSTPGHVNTGAPEYGACAGVSAALLAQQALMTPEPRQLGFHDMDLYKQELASVLRNAMPDHYDD